MVYLLGVVVVAIDVDADECAADFFGKFCPAVHLEVGDDDPGPPRCQLPCRSGADTGRATGDYCAHSVDIHDED